MSDHHTFTVSPFRTVLKPQDRVEWDLFGERTQGIHVGRQEVAVTVHLTKEVGR